jgi:pyruvate dehydrogenase E2 component (dihydrolipoamide acetyltransferase)
MPGEILMPRLSDTMIEGTVVRWLKQPGDRVNKGEALVEVETEKVTMEIEAEAEGVLEKVLIEEGVVPVGAVLGVVGSSVGADNGARTAVEPSAVVAVAAEGVGGTPRVAVPGLPVVQPLAYTRATPIARALARQAGIDLKALGEGTGPGGRILKADVEEWLSRESSRATVRDEGRGLRRDAREPTRMQRTIARRMTEAKQQIPHYYVDTEIDMDALLGLRAQLAALEPSPPRTSINDFVVRACALALREVPAVAASWVDDRLVRSPLVDVGVAITVDDDEGLLVGVIRDADRKSIVEIAAESRLLTERARAGKITPAELEGGTFTVSNLGMFGVHHFHAIINPPESGILAVGAVVERPVVRDGAIVTRNVMTVSLSADHRVYTGATAARFLQAVRGLLEQPLRLLLPPAAAAEGD